MGFYMAELDALHDYIMVILILISYLLFVLLLRLCTRKFLWTSFNGSQALEFIWTAVPAMILVSIAIPSLQLLYVLDEGLDEQSLRVKVVGHQWYWSYEYMDFDNLGFDSYMVPLGEGEFIGFRNLEVDNRLLLPYGARTRVLVSAADVIHSWALPTLGIKLDGTPGRLGQTYVWPRRPGVVYGQCSEICGAYHSFMPIRVEFIKGSKFVEWLRLVGRA